MIKLCVAGGVIKLCVALTFGGGACIGLLKYRGLAGRRRGTALWSQALLGRPL